MMAKYSLVSTMLLGLFTATVIFIGESEQTVLKMLHISDLHQDILYSNTGDPKDHCHNKNGTSLNGSSLFLNPAGDPACDPPPILIESAFKYMQNQNPDIIIWSGDNSPHWDRKIGPKFPYIMSAFKNISRLLLDYFPNSTVIPALGNHDTYYADNYPDFLTNKSALDFYARFIKDGCFGDYLVGESREMFKQCGFYTLSPNIGSVDANIKFIVLNTNLYYNNQLPIDEDDPCGQIEWLEKELIETEEDEQVFIMAHIPPGFYEKNISSPIFTTNNSDVLNQKFANIFRNRTLAAKISAHFYGHTHTDFYRLFIDSHHIPRGVAFNGPAISPGFYLNHTPHGINPSIRMYTYNTTSKTVMNYEQHYLPLNMVRNMKNESEKRPNSKMMKDFTNTNDQPVATNETGVTTSDAVTEESDDDVVQEHDLLGRLVSLWQLSYKATEMFEVPDLSPKSMNTARHVMVDNPESKMFQRFFKHNTVNYIVGNETCSSQCHKELMCTIISITQAEMQKCVGEEGDGEEEKVVDTTTTTKFIPASETTTKTSSSTTSSSSLSTTQTTSTTTHRNQESEVKPGSDTEVVAIPPKSSGRTAEGVAIVLSILVALGIAIGGFLVYKRVQKNRYRSQEFLLTDSVFRYDGYSQVDGF